MHSCDRKPHWKIEWSWWIWKLLSCYLIHYAKSTLFNAMLLPLQAMFYTKISEHTPLNCVELLSLMTFLYFLLIVKELRLTDGRSFLCCKELRRYYRPIADQAKSRDKVPKPIWNTLWWAIQYTSKQFSDAIFTNNLWIFFSNRQLECTLHMLKCNPEMSYAYYGVLLLLIKIMTTTNLKLLFAVGLLFFGTDSMFSLFLTYLFQLILLLLW